MKNKQSRFSHKEQVSQRRHADLITALEAIESREKARLRVAIPHAAAEKLEQFLKEKGLSERQGIPLLIEYGLSDESEEELDKLRLEKESQIHHMYGTYCNMKFRAYEYFMENKAITIRLSFLLSKNQSLKQKLVEEGLQSYLSQDEWDNWNEAEVNEFFRKYVFMNRL
ncbi:MAG: hypothetical protein ACUVQW_04540 [Candidatus Bathycorpusculaceae bacterium]